MLEDKLTVIKYWMISIWTYPNLLSIFCQFPYQTNRKPKIRLKTDCSEKDHWIEFHTDSIQETPWNGNEVKPSVYKGA